MLATFAHHMVHRRQQYWAEIHPIVLEFAFDTDFANAEEKAAVEPGGDA
jgi:hypothetical protein